MENASMKNSGTRSWVQGVCVVAVLAAIAVPLSSLMIAQTTVDLPVSAAPQAIDTSDVVTAEASETSSAVSALMAGSAVGPSRGAVVAPRHPASAYVP
jgi:hypothetical protein